MAALEAIRKFCFHQWISSSFNISTSTIKQFSLFLSNVHQMNYFIRKSSLVQWIFFAFELLQSFLQFSYHVLSSTIQRFYFFFWNIVSLHIIIPWTLNTQDLFHFLIRLFFILIFCCRGQQKFWNLIGLRIIHTFFLVHDLEFIKFGIYNFFGWFGQRLFFMHQISPGIEFNNNLAIHRML